MDGFFFFFIHYTSQIFCSTNLFIWTILNSA